MHFIFENTRGGSLDLCNNDWFYLINIDNQTDANAKISSMTVGASDGDYVNSIRAEARDIVLDFRIKRGVDVDVAQREILNIIKIKQQCSLIWETERAPNCPIKIDGVVQSVTMPHFTNTATMQVGIHCPSGFWEDIEYISEQISGFRGLHYFTESEEMLFFTDEGRAFGEYDMSRERTVTNNGDVDTGVVIDIIAYDAVINPIIRNSDGEFFGLGTNDRPYTMGAGDSVTISTERGAKTVRDDRGVNLYRYIKPNSTWLQIKAGENVLAINSEGDAVDNLTFNIKFKEKYI